MAQTKGECLFEVGEKLNQAEMQEICSHLGYLSIKEGYQVNIKEELLKNDTILICLPDGQSFKYNVFSRRGYPKQDTFSIMMYMESIKGQKLTGHVWINKGVYGLKVSTPNATWIIHGISVKDFVLLNLTGSILDEKRSKELVKEMIKKRIEEKKSK